MPKDKKRISNEGDIEKAKPRKPGPKSKTNRLLVTSKTLVAGCRGLYLFADPPNQTYPKGLKRWMYRYRKLSDGLWTEIGIGHWPLVTFDQAKATWMDHRHKLRYQETDPQDAKKKSEGQRKTFEETAQEYLKMRGRKKGDRWHRQFKLFTVEYGKELARDSVWSISARRVEEAITPVFARSWRQGRDTLRLWAKIFTFARSKGWRPREFENPAQWKDLHEDIFGNDSEEVKHHPAPPYREMPAFMQALRSHQADDVAAIQLEFVILTAVRPNVECRFMRWEEIDWENKIWSIPGPRMKARKPHRVPLSDRAIALLQILKQRATGPYVFPGRRPTNKLIAEQDMIKFLRNTMRITKEVADVHGLGRNPIRDWCAEQNDFDVAAVEMVLAHAFGTKITRAYFRSDLLEKRRAIMDAWAKFLG